MTDTLKAIPGVGPARAKKLSQAKYTLKTLARAKPATVAKKAGIPEAIAQKAITHAQSSAPPKSVSPPRKPRTKKVVKKAVKKPAKKTLAPPKKASKQKSIKKAVTKASHPSGKGDQERIHLLEKTVSELTNTIHKLESRIKRQQQDLHDAQHQLEYLSWDALPRVVHELAWYIRTHLDSWSEEKIFDWLKDHGHEERHIRHALTIARGA